MNRGKQLKILIADDSVVLLKKYEISFKKYFSKVLTAKDGIEAYRLYNKEAPHIVLLDIHMPRLNGLEVLKRIREIDKKTKVIILSGDNERDLILDAINYGVSGYFIKPIARMEMKETLKRIVENIES